MNIAEMRTRVREDLQDTDPATYHWTDAQVDGAVQRCVREYSLAAPIEQMTDLATTKDKTELDISSLAGLLKFESVEFPIELKPPRYQRIAFWGGRLFMTDPGDDNDARVKWLMRHTLGAVSTTIPEEHQEIIVLGATGYLAMSRAAYTVDRASIAGRYGTMNYREWGKERIQEYKLQLKAVSRDRRLKQRTLFTDE